MSSAPNSLATALANASTFLLRQHVELHAFRRLQTIEFVGGDIGGDHLGAFRDECLCDGTADALAGRGDERHFSFQSVAHGFDFPQWLSRGTLFCATR